MPTRAREPEEEPETQAPPAPVQTPVQTPVEESPKQEAPAAPNDKAPEQVKEMISVPKAEFQQLRSDVIAAKDILDQHRSYIMEQQRREQMAEIAKRNEKEELKKEETKKEEFHPKSKQTVIAIIIIVTILIIIGVLYFHFRSPHDKSQATDEPTVDEELTDQ